MIHKYTLMGHNIVLDVHSGAVHLMDKLAYDTLDHMREPPENREVYDELMELKRTGQLFSSDDTGKFVEHMGLSPVKAMCLNVSHDCNLRCEYCFAGEGDYSGDKSLMSFETGKRAIDFLIKYSEDRKYLEVDFFGGEPLLNLNTVKQIVEYARAKEKEHDKAFRFTLTTNGVLLDDETIAYINAEMSNVVLSLDGRREINDRMRGTGVYDRVVNSFQKLVKSRGDKEYYVRGTFTAYNKDFADDVQTLAELGFDQISVEPVVADEAQAYALRESDLPEIFAEYERLAQILIDAKREEKGYNFFHFMLDLEQGPCVIKRLRGCGCGNEYIAITPEGDIYPCHQFIGHEEWRMGSLCDGTFDHEMKERFSRVTVNHKPECRDCWAKFYCSGGCHANNMQYTGDLLGCHKLSCELEKKRVECAIAMKAELL